MGRGGDPRGSRPLDYLRMLAEAPGALVIHGNYLGAEELFFLGKNRIRMSLVYCPRTHAYFQHAPYPLSRAMAVSVRVVLGTDSRASNPDLDLLTEMRHVAHNPIVDPHDVLRMGTLSGAKALGRSAEVGSIAPRKYANIVAIPIPDGTQGASELLAAIFAGESRPSWVWFRGKKVPESRPIISS